MTEDEQIKTIQDRIPHLSKGDREMIYYLTGRLTRASVRTVIDAKADGKPVFVMDYQIYLNFDMNAVVQLIRSLREMKAVLFVTADKSTKDMAATYMSTTTFKIHDSSIATLKKFDQMRHPKRLVETMEELKFPKDAIILVEELPKDVIHYVPIENTSPDITKLWNQYSQRIE